MKIKRRDLSQQDRINLEYWLVLQKINREYLYRNKNTHIRYRFSREKIYDQDELVDEFKIVKLLSDQKVVEIEDNSKNHSEIDTLIVKAENKFTVEFALQIIPEKFFATFAKYQKKVSNIKGLFDSEDYTRYFGFDEKTFWLRRSDNSRVLIPFYPKLGETTGPYCLMFAFVELLRTNGDRNGSYLRVVVDKDEIINLIDRKFKMNIGSGWLKSTKGNLIKKIPQDFGDFIKFDDYDRKQQGYPFTLKLPW